MKYKKLSFIIPKPAGVIILMDMKTNLFSKLKRFGFFQLLKIIHFLACAALLSLGLSPNKSYP